MFYFDYSATTPTNKKVLKYFNKINKYFFANANSIHSLGVDSKHFIDLMSEQILNLFQLKDYEVIFTSGASEANNLVIKGLSNISENKGKHMITTYFEHPSITVPLSYLQKQGYEIDIVKNDANGLVDLKHLKELIREDTVLVSIGSVNSEIGIKQPLEAIKKVLKKYPNCYLHSDVTQSVGKVDLQYNDLDFFTFSAHKFYGIKGVGALVKKKDIKIQPLIHGGNSTSIYRSGTPAPALIGSLTKALEIAILNLNENYLKVIKNYNYLIEEFKKIPKITLNSNEFCIPHIINISVLNEISNNYVLKLEEKGLFISNHTACSSKSDKSLAVYMLTKDEQLAKSSIRISLSHLTKKREIKQLLKILKEND